MFNFQNCSLLKTSDVNEDESAKGDRGKGPRSPGLGQRVIHLYFKVVLLTQDQKPAYFGSLLISDKFFEEIIQNCLHFFHNSASAFAEFVRLLGLRSEKSGGWGPGVIAGFTHFTAQLRFQCACILIYGGNWQDIVNVATTRAMSAMY